VRVQVRAQVQGLLRRNRAVPSANFSRGSSSSLSRGGSDLYSRILLEVRPQRVRIQEWSEDLGRLLSSTHDRLRIGSDDFF
jgi:hypothetical protein